MYFYRFRNFYSEYVIYLICILCLMTCSCTHISSFSLNTQSQFSPQVNLSNEDKFFLAPDKSLQNNDLIYVNIENSVRSVFQNLGLHVVNLLSQANYFVTHGTTTTKPVYGYTGTELSSYKYIQYYNGVGLKIYSISNNNYNLISDIAIIWKDSTPDIFIRIDLASLVLRELLIAKTTSRRIYTFRWEDNKLSAFTWTPWM